MTPVVRPLREGALAVVVFVAPCLLWPTYAHAQMSGGYFSGNKGARAAGRAGAFTAKADDLTAVAYNPAGLARLRGTTAQAGNRFSYNAQDFTRQPTLDWGNVSGGVPPLVEFATVSNETPSQPFEPLLGAVSDFGLPDWAFAVSAYSPAGIGRQRYPEDGGNRYLMVSRNARLINYGLSAAWQHEGQFALGATVQWVAAPLIEYQLVIDANTFPGRANPVNSELDVLSTIRGSDLFTPNAILGAWYRPTAFLELGVSGQIIPTSLEAKGRLRAEAVNPEIIDEIVLERDGVEADDVQLTLPLPITARFGIRYRGLTGEEQREAFDIELDLSYESWSRVRNFTVDTDGLVANLLGQMLDIDRVEVAKQWRDTFAVQLGGDVNVIPETLQLRAGVFYESAVARKAYSHIDFVSGQELGGAVGTSFFVGALEVALAYEYRVQPSVSLTEGEARVYQEVPGSQCPAPFTDPDLCHPQYLGQPAPAVNAGTYDAFSHAASLDVLYRF